MSLFQNLHGTIFVERLYLILASAVCSCIQNPANPVVGRAALRPSRGMLVPAVRHPTVPCVGKISDRTSAVVHKAMRLTDVSFLRRPLHSNVPRSPKPRI